MRYRPVCLPLLLLSLTMCAAHATIIYSGVRDVPVPLDFEGAYLRPDTGATAGSFPANWATAPWLNPFFGGVDIGNSPLLRPVITGADQIVNLSLGDYIDSASHFATGESGSTTHVGNAPSQFALGVPGYLGFVFNTTVGGPDYYGWIALEIQNSASGKITEWAYEDTSGTAIQAGLIPEPTAGAFLGVALLAIGLRRKRR